MCLSCFPLHKSHLGAYSIGFEFRLEPNAMQQRTVTASCHLYCCCHRNGIVVTLWHTESITSCRGGFPSCREGVAPRLRHAPALSCMQGMSSINPERQSQSAETRCVGHCMSVAQASAQRLFKRSVVTVLLWCLLQQLIR